jgi:hypothetical protein
MGFKTRQYSRMSQSLRKNYRTVMVYAILCASFMFLGYRWSSEPSKVTALYYVREPTSPADIELLYSNVSDFGSKKPVTEDIALIRERDPDDHVQVVYWSPKRANEWGSIEIEFEWEPGFDPAFAILDPSLHLFGNFDPTASGEFAVASEATGNRWVTLAVIEAIEDKFTLQHAVDVSRWVKGSQSLRIRYRVKASSLMYHPTPDDPIGLAAAQCLRQQINKPELEQSKYASRLRLWKSHPDDD